jgi:hypothetical protein
LLSFTNACKTPAFPGDTDVVATPALSFKDSVSVAKPTEAGVFAPPATLLALALRVSHSVGMPLTQLPESVPPPQALRPNATDSTAMPIILVELVFTMDSPYQIVSTEGYLH